MIIESTELEKFINMVMLYEQVGNLTTEDNIEINMIEKIIDKPISVKISIINTRYSEIIEEENIQTAEDLFFEVFGMSLPQLNELADTYEFQRVA